MSTILEAKSGMSTTPMTDYERELVHKLRTMLKDLPEDVLRTLNTLVEQQRGERWTDAQLLVYLNWAVGDFNAQPLQTNYTLESIQGNSALESCILLGAQFQALFAESVLQSGESFSYSDNGLSVSIDLASKYSGLASQMAQSYSQMKSSLKMYIRPGCASIVGNPSGVRIRAYAPRQWTYR